MAEIGAKLVNNGTRLQITLDLNEVPVLSKSQKTYVVATSHGNIPTKLTVDGKTVTIGVNAYIRK